jgi:hypothetical protein
MRKLVVVLMAVGMFSAMPVLAAEHEGMHMGTTEAMRECSMASISLSERITNIQKEIDTRKHTPSELNQLKIKLQNAESAMADAQKG